MEKAQKELDHTKKDDTPDPKYDKAIDHYKKAWKDAQKAMKQLSKPEQDLGCRKTIGSFSLVEK